MSIEELLKPRYKVIADWPMNHFFDVGDIIEMKMMANGRYWNGEDSYYLTEEQMRTFPHMFKKLEWWEERPIEDIPMYIRFGEFNNPPFAIYKIIKWNNLGQDYKDYEPYGFAEIPPDYFISLKIPLNFPATKEQYIQYQQNKNV